MYKLDRFNLILWALAILLCSTTFFNYFMFISGDSFNIFWGIMPVMYLVFLVAAILLSDKLIINLRSQWHVLFIFGMLFLNIAFVIYSSASPKYSVILSGSLEQLPIVLVSFLICLLIQPKVINEVLNRYYLVFFVIGILFLVFTSFNIIDKNAVLNSNTWGFFIAPFLIYLFIIKEGLVMKAIVFVIGVFLLYLTGSRTTMLVFIALPFIMMLFHFVKRPRLIYSAILVFGLVLTYVVAIAQSDILSDLLSRRDIIWLAYWNNVTDAFSSIVAGTGQWKAPIGIERMEGHGAHNTFLSLFHYNGIIALGMYLCFIIFGVRKYANKFTVSDGVLFLAIAFQFSETNAPLFTYIFPSFIFLINILLNKSSESLD